MINCRFTGNLAEGDALSPSLEAALESMLGFEWVGLTDLFEQSLCLLHYQANGTLPAACVCGSVAHGRRRFVRRLTNCRTCAH